MFVSFECFVLSGSGLCVHLGKGGAWRYLREPYLRHWGTAFLSSRPIIHVDLCSYARLLDVCQKTGGELFQNNPYTIKVTLNCFNKTASENILLLQGQ